MKISEIKSREEFIKYVEDRQFKGMRAEDDTQEKLFELCNQYNVPKSVLRMHYDIRKK